MVKDDDNKNKTFHSGSQDLLWTIIQIYASTRVELHRKSSRDLLTREKYSARVSKQNFYFQLLFDVKSRY